VLSLVIADAQGFDVIALFDAKLRSAPVTQRLLVSPLTGKSLSVSAEQALALASMPAGKWIDSSEACEQLAIKQSQLRSWLSGGFLLSDANEAALTRLRTRNELLRESGWEPGALLHFAASRWSQVVGSRFQNIERDNRESTSRDSFDAQAKKYGLPPSAFHDRDVENTVALPEVHHDSELGRLLARRETTRLFDESIPLAQQDLATILHFAFGHQGEKTVTADFKVLKKYNPSGGALHSLEAYPLVLNVEGVDPGLYHYRSAHGDLGLIKPMKRSDAVDFVLDALAGQHWYQSAHAIIFMTSRFERSFWKYRNHTKAYKSIVMDSGHVSQTIYLMATQLTLGAFVTMAMNDTMVEEALNLDFLEEGLVAACGIGVPKRDGDAFSLEYEPRKI
jgi:putative peptide maturation dehydrogenase